MLVLSMNRYCNFQSCACAIFALDFKAAIHQTDPFFDTEKPIMPCWNGRRVESTTVILYRDRDALVFHPDIYFHILCLGVMGDVGESFCQGANQSLF